MDDTPSPALHATARDEPAWRPFETVAGDASCGFLVLCDHAGNEVPEPYGALGLPAAEFERHIAYDPGAGALARALAREIGAPAILARFSRLLVDPNRGTDDPTLVMRLSDGSIVPGNAAVDEAERARRIELFHEPYHRAVEAAIETAVAAGRPPALVSVHSFTPVWRGVARRWHAGILWDRDPRLAVPLIAALRAEDGLEVGDNEPYSGRLNGDTMYRHGTMRGLAHALVEVRQDLLADEDGVTRWCAVLAGALRGVAREGGLNDIRFHGSAAPGHGAGRQE